MATIDVVRGGRWIGSMRQSRLCVSVGASACEGKNLRALLTWAAQRFDACCLVIADTLQRHNREPNLSEEARWVEAKLDGENWLNRNRSIIEEFENCVDLHRWDEWLKRADFPPALKTLTALEHSSPLFRETLLNDVDRFLKRKPALDNASGRERSKAYILEELAVLSLIEADIPAVEFYPGSLPKTGSVLARGRIEGAPQSLSSVRLMQVRVNGEETEARGLGTYDSHDV